MMHGAKKISKYEIVFSIAFLVLGFFIGLFLRKVPVLQVDKNINLVHFLNVIITGIIVFYLNTIYSVRKDNNRKLKDILIDRSKEISIETSGLLGCICQSEGNYQVLIANLKIVRSNFNHLNGHIKPVVIDSEISSQIKAEYKNLKDLITNIPITTSTSPPLVYVNDTIKISSERMTEIVECIEKIKKR